MAKKSIKSKNNCKAKTTEVQTKKKLQVRVRSLKDLQVTKDKKTEKDNEMEENIESDCEVIEMPEGGGQGSTKRKNSEDKFETESASEPKMLRRDATSVKSATKPFVASQRRGRDAAASLSSVQVTFLYPHSQSIYPYILIITGFRC